MFLRRAGREASQRAIETIKDEKGAHVGLEKSRCCLSELLTPPAFLVLVYDSFKISSHSIRLIFSLPKFTLILKCIPKLSLNTFRGVAGVG